ncbi:MAG: hypothetical protein J6E43_00085 [Prevotella sp.]|nr:hypothetical protein [Prevotella sp.]
MKKVSVIMMVAVAVWMMASCGGKTNQVPFDNGDSAEIANADPTVYGVCGEFTEDKMLQLLTDTGDTLNLDLAPAVEEEKIFGGMAKGDRMAVVPTKDLKSALAVIDQSTLLGNWVMPNPIDGSDEVGICIKEGGIAESIDQSTINYKTWRLTRGKLEIMLVHDGGSGEDEIFIYDIVKLTNDSLVYQDSEDVYEYSRQKPREKYGEDIELEKSALEDFQM